MQRAVRVVRGLILHFDRIQGKDGANRRLGNLNDTGQLVQFEGSAVFRFVVIRQRRQIERNQLAAFQGTNDDLLAAAIMGNNRGHQVCQYRLQQKTGDQRPGNQCAP